MKSKYKFIFVCMLFSVCSVVSKRVNNIEENLKDIDKDFSIDYKIIEIPEKKLELKPFSDFLDTLSFKESSNRWYITNRFGYIGKYQFGKLALADLGLEIDAHSFKEDPNIFPERVQDSLILEYIKIQRRYLNKHISKYKGKIINGIKVTESGIIAAAHLVGHKSVKLWLDSKGKIERLDGNNISLELYMKYFKDYKIPSKISSEYLCFN